jgi:hypothetical protein
MRATPVDFSLPDLDDALRDPFDEHCAGLVGGRPLFARLLDVVADAGLPGEWGAAPKEPER